MKRQMRRLGSCQLSNPRQSRYSNCQLKMCLSTPICRLTCPNYRRPCLHRHAHLSCHCCRRRHLSRHCCRLSHRRRRLNRRCHFPRLHHDPNPGAWLCHSRSHRSPTPCSALTPEREPSRALSLHTTRIWPADHRSSSQRLPRCGGKLCSGIRKLAWRKSS